MVIPFLFFSFTLPLSIPKSTKVLPSKEECVCRASKAASKLLAFVLTKGAPLIQLIGGRRGRGERERGREGGKLKNIVKIRKVTGICRYETHLVEV